MEKDLTMVETRDRVREFLGKELKWRARANSIIGGTMVLICFHVNP